MYQRLNRFKEKQKILLFGHSDDNVDDGAMGGVKGAGGEQRWMHQLRGGI